MSLNVHDGGSGGRLGFVDLARKTFAFLFRLGFVMGQSEATLVRFERRDVFVNVYHGRASYQVGLEVGRLSEGDLYSLHEILSVVAPGQLHLALCQTTKPDVLANYLASIADVLETKCAGLLAGDALAFEALRSVVASERREATIQAQFGAVRDRADHAWEAKDLERAAELYEQAYPALDATRLRRLAYLRKKKEPRDE